MNRFLFFLLLLALGIFFSVDLQAQGRPTNKQQPKTIEISVELREAIDRLEDRSADDRYKLPILEDWQSGFNELTPIDQAAVLEALRNCISGDYTELPTRITALALYKKLYATLPGKEQKAAQDFWFSCVGNTEVPIDLRVDCLDLLGEHKLSRPIKQILRDIEKEAENDEKPSMQNEDWGRIGTAAHRYAVLLADGKNAEVLDEALQFFNSAWRFDKSGKLMEEVAHSLRDFGVVFAPDRDSLAKVARASATALEKLLDELTKKTSVATNAEAATRSAMLSGLHALVDKELAGDPQKSDALIVKVVPYLPCPYIVVSASAARVLVKLAHLNPNHAAKIFAELSAKVLDHGENVTATSVLALISLVVPNEAGNFGDQRRVYLQFVKPVAQRFVSGLVARVRHPQDVTAGQQEILFQGLAQLLLALLPDAQVRNGWLSNTLEVPVNKGLSRSLDPAAVVELLREFAMFAQPSSDIDEQKIWLAVREVAIYGVAALSITTPESTGDEDMLLLATLLNERLLDPALSRAVLWGLTQRHVKMGSIRVKASMLSDMRRFLALPAEYKLSLLKGFERLRNDQQVMRLLDDEEVWAMGFFVLMLAGDSEVELQAWFASEARLEQTISIDGKNLTVRSWMQQLKSQLG